MAQHKNYATPRRKDRQITNDAALHHLLASAEIGYLATAIENQPFVIPYLFWFDGERVFLHSAQKGRTKSNIQQNPRVCFTVAERGRYLPANTAMAFSVEYSSVVVFGTAILLDSIAEKTYALQGLLDKYFPHLKSGDDYRPITEKELNATAVFVINIDAISGKQKSAAADFPAAGQLRAFDTIPNEEF